MGTISIEKMTLDEKLKTMELLWDDLCANHENIPSPAWHKPILEERDKLLEEGRETPVDWNEAEKSIRNSTE